MRIAQIAPLTEAIPPKLYGGAERGGSWPTEEIRALGHEVSVFARGGSGSSAQPAGVGPPAFSSVPVLSISNAQRRPLPQAGWVSTVPHGLPERLFTPQPVTPRYLAFLGRIAPEKGVDRAVSIAKKSGLPLKVAAKVDNVDREYYETQIRPLFQDANIEFIGEIGDHQKSEFLSGAVALLMPIDWPQPVRLVMTEALACGTPVVASRTGSVPA